MLAGRVDHLRCLSKKRTALALARLRFSLLLCVFVCAYVCDMGLNIILHSVQYTLGVHWRVAQRDLLPRYVFYDRSFSGLLMDRKAFGTGKIARAI